VPSSQDTSMVVVHHPQLEISAGQSTTVRAEVVSQTAPGRVELWARAGGGREFNRLPMARVQGFTYEAAVPGALGADGSVEYAIRVGQGEHARIFPGGRTGGEPGDTLWRVAVAAEGSPVVLFDAQRDAQRILHPHPYRYVRFQSETVDG